MVSILGISAFYHDSAAAILVDGKILAAAQEERFTRKKHDSSYPFNAVEYVLKFSELKLSQIDYIVFYEKPFLKFERLLETYVAFAPRGFKQFTKSMPAWLREKLFQKNLLLKLLKEHDKSFSDEKKIYFSEHHLSHAASAFFPSPFKDAIVLTADGVGEWATTTVAVGNESDLSIKKEIHFPHSLGLLYSAFTVYLGFKVKSGEYKLMGLAPYGEPKYANLIKEENIQFDVIFGPAYKGIPLAAAVATIISGRTSNLVSISFDRKEEKTHGEGGKIVGSVKGKKVLILDDVLTAGTALNQSINLVREMGGEVVSSMVALDREELVEGVLARDMIEEKTNSKLLSIATISQLVDFFNQTNKTKEARLISEYLSKQ